MPKLKVIPHATVPAGYFQPREVFEFNGSVFIGAQFPPFGEYEFAWDNDNLGRWASLTGSRGTPFWSHPTNMSLRGGRQFYQDDESFVRLPVGEAFSVSSSSSSSSAVVVTSSTSSGSSSSLEIPIEPPPEDSISGPAVVPGQMGWTPVTPTCAISDLTMIQWPPTLKWSVYETNSGIKVAEGITTPRVPQSQSNQVQLPTIYVGAGSYVLWAQIGSAQAAYRLPPGYAIDERFYYMERNYRWIYDPYFNIGRIPGKTADEAGQNLMSVRRQILQAGNEKDKPEWARYLISPDRQAGEWSVLRFVVGDSPWTLKASNVPTQSPALLRIHKEGENTTINGVDYGMLEPIVFDALARSVTASLTLTLDYKTETGKVLIPAGTKLIAGSRTDSGGSVIALWILHDDLTATLLGINPDPSTGMCECAMLDHAATDIEQDLEGNIWILSKCGLYVYNPAGVEIGDRLVGIPPEDGGHPGGQTLRRIGGSMYFFTEAFGFSVPGSITFYNYMISQAGTERVKGPGTVCHVACEADRWLGMLWGIQQTAPSEAEGAMTYITWFDGWRWALTDELPSSGLVFSANQYRWQRLRVMNNKMYAFGKAVPGEEAIAGVANGTTFNRLGFDYRVRRLTPGPASQSLPDFEESLYAYGRDSSKLLPGQTLEDLPWSIIEITGQVENVVFGCGDCDDDCCCVSLEELNATGVETDDLPPYWIYTPVGYRPSMTLPSDFSEYLTLRFSPTQACYCLGTPPGCAFLWNADGFQAKIADLVAAGVDIESLPGWLVWNAANGTWKPSANEPDGTSPFLIKDVSSEEVWYFLSEHSVMPYDPSCCPEGVEEPVGNGLSCSSGVNGEWGPFLWCRPQPECPFLVFNPLEGTLVPHFMNSENVLEPCECMNAALCALPGEKFQAVRLAAGGDEINAFQVVDVTAFTATSHGLVENGDYVLERDRTQAKTLWYRVRPEGEEEPDVSTTEKARLYLEQFVKSIHFNQSVMLSKPCKTEIEVLILVPLTTENLQLPVIVRRY